MTVEFALFLSPQGIALAHRQAEGHWALIGDTALDVPDLGAALTDLRAKGEARAGPGFPTLLILPDDQILYTTVSGVPALADLPSRLDGLTPYPLDEIAYDHRDLGDGTYQLAVVARETLNEAEGFASGFGFFGVGFAASPPVEKFAGVPLFQRSAEAAGLTLPETGLAIGPDTWTPPEPEPVPEPVPESDDAADAPAIEAAEMLPDAAPDLDAHAPPEAAEDDLSRPVQRKSASADPGDAPRPEDTAPEAPEPEPDTNPAAAAEDPLEPVTKTATPRSKSDPPEPIQMPTGFGARRGKAPAPDSAGQIVGSRQARFGLTTTPTAAPAPTVETPQTAAAAERDTGISAPPRSPASYASSAPGRRLSVPPAPPDMPTVRVARPDHPATAAQTAAPAADTPRPGILDRFRRPRPAKPAAAAPTPGAEAGGDAPIMGGLLAKRADTPSGPSLKTGLILTLILLLILALVAVWSALFLPDSTVARWLGREAPSVAEAPTTPPTVVTAPAPVDRSDELARLTPEVEAPSTPAPLTETPSDALPDIDAELDLGPAPVDPETLLPSPEETEALYASTGIWQRPPEAPSALDPSLVDEIAMAAIDPVVVTHDALALPAPDLSAVAEQLRRYPSPAPFGTVFTLGPDGLIQPTEDGVFTPDGVFVRLGTPAIAAVPRPRTPDPVTADTPTETDSDTAVATAVATARLASFQPTPRPADLIERRERQVLGGFTLSELANRRPTARPPSVQQLALAARLAPSDSEAETETGGAGATFDAAALTGTESGTAQIIQASALAVASSRMPSSRPGDISEIVARATRSAAPSGGGGTVQQASVRSAPARVEPSIPSSATVSRAATQSNQINLRRVNLIGVSGTPSARTALVRLPSGRFVRVSVGDRVDGGRVAAISEDSLQYVKNGRNITLEVPG